MKLVVAIDSFKGSVSSWEAGLAASRGIRAACPEAQVCVKPVADGGEGTVDALVAGLGGIYRTVKAHDPLFRPVKARYGVIGQTAVIEMAACAGLALVEPQKRNPLFTTTYGVGELIRDALTLGCRDFLIGIGGSATNDGGVGMLQALGYRFADADGNSIPFGAGGLEALALIDGASADPALRDCRFRIACDVTNPLCGENGCSAVFAPQKGAKQTDIPRMDAALSHYAKQTKRLYSHADPDRPGAGAAGGMGFAFLSYLNGELCPGITLIAEKTALEADIRNADLVFTGEGRLDRQTVMGKVPVGVARLAKKYGKPVVALAGCVTADASVCNQYGIDAFFPILPAVCSLEQAMQKQNALQNLERSAEQIMRLFLSAKLC